LDGEVLGHRG